MNPVIILLFVLFVASAFVAVCLAYSYRSARDAAAFWKREAGQWHERCAYWQKYYERLARDFNALHRKHYEDVDEADWWKHGGKNPYGE